MTPLRVVHAVRSDAFAGVEHFVRRLAIAQAGDGHTVTVLGGAEAAMRPVLEQAGVAYHPAVRTTGMIVQLVRLARHVDVINTHMTAADVAAVAALWPRRHRPAVVSTRHFARRRGRFRMLPLDGLVGTVVDAELCISEAVARATGVPGHVVHTGVDDRPAVMTPRDRVVLVAQRLQPEKETGLALRAFASSGIDADGWTLQIAGEGAAESDLRRLADELGLDHTVRFLGFRSDVPDMMARAGMLIAPCSVEGLGLTVLEALASGLPVIAADAAGHREVLDGLDPRARFTPRDAGAAAGALHEFASDEPARTALGDAGRARQRAAFSIEAQVRGTDAVYRAAIVGRVRKRRRAA